MSDLLVNALGPVARNCLSPGLAVDGGTFSNISRQRSSAKILASAFHDQR
jgi:hypothetical protein